MKLVVFDLDDTLIDGSCCDKVLKDTLAVLDYLKKNHVLMAIASDNADALWYLKKNKLEGYFVAVEAFRAQDKTPHLIRILRETGILKSECLLVDDCPENVASCNTFGVKSMLVDHTVGVTFSDIQEIFKRTLV